MESTNQHFEGWKRPLTNIKPKPFMLQMMTLRSKEIKWFTQHNFNKGLDSRANSTWFSSWLQHENILSLVFSLVKAIFTTNISSQNQRWTCCYPTTTQVFIVLLYAHHCTLLKSIGCKYTDNFISLREGYFNCPREIYEVLGKENYFHIYAKETKPHA